MRRARAPPLFVFLLLLTLNTFGSIAAQFDGSRHKKLSGTESCIRDEMKRKQKKCITYKNTQDKNEPRQKCDTGCLVNGQFFICSFEDKKNCQLLSIRMQVKSQ